MIIARARRPVAGLFVLSTLFWAYAAALALAADTQIEAFVGSYSGSAEVQTWDGQTATRDLSVDISETKRGFVVNWSTTTYRQDGRSSEKTYEIEFVPSDRDGIFAAAMTKNVFGHAVQQDPMKGEPYVWSRIAGDTLTVYSLFVDEAGGYELQQFDRTLTDGGLELAFQSIKDGAPPRQINTFLARQ